ncbi:MAG: hypothetical protein EA375_03505 [Acholeplasmataceae bacterium]|nr:MAG: hypothetical protein EA375_03505 [Acholeplasmataceae bacterium]
MNKRILVFLSVVFMLVIWLAAFIMINTPLLFPSPLQVGRAFANLMVSFEAWSALAASILRLLLMVVISLVMALFMALYASRHPRFEIIIRPYITILRTIPVISIIVILLIVAGFTRTPYIATFLMIFPLLYQGILDAVKDIPQDYRDVFALEDGRLIPGWFHNELPLVKNQFATVLLQACGLGVKVLIMTEYLSQTPRSIGAAIYIARIYFRYDEVFAWTLILILLVLAIEMGIRKLQIFNLRHA